MKKKKFISEIKSMNPLSTDAMNKFTDLVSDKTNYNMISVNCVFTKELYETLKDPNQDDIQILYEGSPNVVGHYICLHYSAKTNIVRIYDSYYNDNRLSARAQDIIDHRYSNYKFIQFIVPQTNQLDRSSCGVLSIAYATALIMGDDLADIEFKLNKFSKNKTKSLRKHLVKMLRKNIITSFPSN